MIFVAYRIYESQMHNIVYCDHKGLILSLQDALYCGGKGVKDIILPAILPGRTG